MKKILQIALVLTALALFSTACSKVRTTNLIGTYKSGTSTMSVSSDGTISFDIASDATGALASLKNITSYGGGGNRRPNVLIPWDLTSEKSSYDYEVQVFFSEQQGGSGQPTYHDATLKYKFTKDKESVKCDVSVTVPQGKGESGTVTFSK